eukprot:TRINITY_DN1057_c0_g1_i4.p1 TRINITY_DN1057_c0_g1~~TRINITY_DN1057_c0_g1_i4.p1  ORF type:complete len:334 (-),score=127.86 TRINITY_DN1057_c0_g1_i4:648-1649(-)
MICVCVCCLQYEDEMDYGGFGKIEGKIEIVQKIHHDGDVNKARYMPQNPCIISTMTQSGEVHIFEYNRHPAKPAPSAVPKPDVRLVGHEKEGYGMDWNVFTAGRLLTGADDAKVCLWDLDGNQKAKVEPVSVFAGHKDVVEDVCWHRTHDYMFGSVGDDRQLMIWDTRKNSTNKPAYATEAHEAEVNCVSFSPFSEFVLLTGSSDKTLKLFDIRNLKTELHSFVGHNDEVTQCMWSPFNETIFASTSGDRRVNIWDVSRIGQEQTSLDAQDGCPELLFVHGGHTARVSDMSWNPNEPWMMASTSEDNVLQVWQMAENVYCDEEEDDIPEAELE